MTDQSITGGQMTIRIRTKSLSFTANVTEKSLPAIIEEVRERLAGHINNAVTITIEIHGDDQ